MTERDRYDEMVRQDIAAQLKAEGFRRARNRFARWRNDCWEIIDFQASQWGDRHDVRFTINLASAVTGLPKRSAWDEKKPPPEAAAHVRERIGILIDGRDQWWEFDASTDADALGAELLALLRRVGMPWLESRSGLERLLALIADAPSDLGWHDLRILPKLLREAGYADAADAVEMEAAERDSP